MNIKDEHTSRLWTFIMKGEIMAFELDDDEMIATRINNKAASWKEVEEYIEKYYVKKDKIREALDITATVLGDKYELDYQDIQDVIAETITKIRQELLD